MDLATVTTKMLKEPEFVKSRLSQEIASDGYSVTVEIYQLEGDGDWSLEVIDEYNNSTLWDNKFSTELDALTEAKKSILEDGIGSFVGPEGYEGWGG